MLDFCHSLSKPVSIENWFVFYSYQGVVPWKRSKKVLQAFLVFSQHPAWVYHAGKLIEKVFYCLSIENFLKIEKKK